MTNNELLSVLFKNQNLKYKEFNDKIINTNKNIIGVRTPVLKKISKQILKGDYELFLNDVKDDYYEQILLKGFVIAGIKDPNLMFNKLDDFTYKIDNWAICDMVVASLKLIKDYKELALSFVNKNIRSNNVWKVRVCFIILLYYFIDEKYLSIIFDYVENDKNTFYYVMMAKAWIISECYIKYPMQTKIYLNKTKIDYITYNKSISKICESKRVGKTDKITLKKMKKKSKNA